MKDFNLSEWALNHRSFTWFLMLVAMFAGVLSYMSMGREEDPAFPIPTMVVAAAMPGATAQEMLTQVTDRIESKLQELDGLDVTRSVTYPGQTVVYVDVDDSVKGDAVDAAWLRVRNLMADIRGEFPQEFQGFSFNDDFGAVYGNVYAFTADGFDAQEVKAYVETIRDEVQKLDDAGRVALMGTREPVVNVEFSATRLAALGLDAQSVLNALAAQNQIVPSGSIQTAEERLLIRVSG
ncbi:MAG: efflux RND transporter permease subunit, partial [Maritimibacter sp.]|nr:efflux RND transporter permease subunit [Maritimibacter sp.]